MLESSALITRGEFKLNVLFDLGNVVINWDTQSVVETLALTKAQAQLMKRELFDHSDWGELDHGLATEPEVVERVCRRTNFSANTVNDALHAARTSLTPISESIALMRELKDAGLPIYCLSNMSIETYQHIKDKMDFFDCFEGIVISGQEKCMKPNAAIFRLTLDRFSLQASDTFFIDDSEANISSATNLGIPSYQFKRTEYCYQYLRERLL
ncbi:MAG: putative hydrolase of the HAD superfamily [Halioglobus sp.]|jgi:putative hydrolase of the HAD superfamily